MTTAAPEIDMTDAILNKRFTIGYFVTFCVLKKQALPPGKTPKGIYKLSKWREIEDAKGQKALEATYRPA